MIFVGDLVAVTVKGIPLKGYELGTIHKVIAVGTAGVWLDTPEDFRGSFAPYLRFESIKLVYHN